MLSERVLNKFLNICATQTLDDLKYYFEKRDIQGDDFISVHRAPSHKKVIQKGFFVALCNGNKPIADFLLSKGATTRSVSEEKLLDKVHQKYEILKILSYMDELGFVSCVDSVMEKIMKNGRYYHKATGKFLPTKRAKMIKREIELRRLLST